MRHAAPRSRQASSAVMRQGRTPRRCSIRRSRQSVGMRRAVRGTCLVWSNGVTGQVTVKMSRASGVDWRYAVSAQPVTFVLCAQNLAGGCAASAGTRYPSSSAFPRGERCLCRMSVHRGRTSHANASASLVRLQIAWSAPCSSSRPRRCSACRGGRSIIGFARAGCGRSERAAARSGC